MTLVAYDLRCEHLHEPLGLDEPRPRLQWRLRSEVQADTQEAFRVRVVHPDGAAWDRGWHTAGDVEVEYDGAALEPATRYEWTVTVRGRDGAETTSSSWFETGLGAWSAHWVGADPEARPAVDPPQDDDILGDGILGHLNRRLPPCAHLRHEFELPSAPRSARLYVSAKGLYEARLNGERVGDVELAPGWTDYHSRIEYQAYDVTSQLRTGHNAVGVVLADGWWSGRVGPDGRRLGRHYGDAPELLAELHVVADDGTRTVIGTDGAWRSGFGALRFADLLAGEYVDARRDPVGWDLPGFDAGAWTPVLDRGRDTSFVVDTRVQPVRATAECRPQELTDLGGGRWMVDFGQNLVGRVRLTLNATSPGAAVQLRHGEMLEPDGSLYTANLRLASATDVYRCAGRASEVFEPRFTFHGFRYCEVTGVPDLEPDDLVGVVLHSDTPQAGSVLTSDPTVNQLLSNIWWGQRGNFVSVPTDCPQRDERLGWLADAQVFLPTACLNADVAAFFARWMRDVVTSRLPNGAFPDVAPRLVFERNGAPGWGDAGVIVPWHLWRTYGDRRTLEHCYPAMVGWVEHVLAHNPDLVWTEAVGNHYGDWLQSDVVTPRPVLATAYFARSARLVARSAEVLGRRADADRFHALADDVAVAFRSAFVGEDGRVLGETQTGYLLALAFDLLPDHLRGAAAEHLAADVVARGHRLSTGFLGVALLCPVLADHGRADLAYALLHQDAYPSWAYSIRHGATTIWERWDGWTEGHGFQSVAMNSFNHYSLGSVGEWLFRDVAGIAQDDDSVAWERLLLRPRIGGRLTWAQGRYESARGLVETSWRIEDDTLVYEAVVPPGTTARLELPDGSVGELTSGRHRVTLPWPAG